MKPLGRKQRVSNDQWEAAVAGIAETVSRQHIDDLIQKTVSDIRDKTEGKKAAYAWSGGKDSLVLGRLCEMAGIKDCVLVVSDLEYPAFVSWVEQNKPERLEIVNTHQDIKWLSEHEHMLFPQDAATAGKWFHMVQHRGQAQYFKQHKLDMILLGRRRADGNYVGKGTNIYTNNRGVTRFSPIADWSHEDVLAFIHYYNIPVPPIYGWKNGYLVGTGPWAARQWTGSIENGWAEVYDIDPSVVKDAALHIQSAADFLKGKEAV